MSNDLSSSPSETAAAAAAVVDLEYPKCTADLWKSCQRMIDETSFHHVFLTQLVDGTLSHDCFQYYVVQDALYLQDFADCLRLLSQKATSPKDQERLEAFAVGAEEAELSLHKSFFQQWKIEVDATNATQMPHTLLYTSYMKRVVVTGSYAQGLAVLLPCFWVYHHVGQCLLEYRRELLAKSKYVNLPINNEDGSLACPQQQRPPQYDAWIDMYGGEEFEKDVKDYIAMVDAEMQRIQKDEEEKEHSIPIILKEMQRHFAMSCKLEHMFWDQALAKLQWPTIGGM